MKQIWRDPCYKIGYALNPQLRELLEQIQIYGETLDVIGCALNPQLRELLEQTFAAFSPPLCVRKTSICQNMKKFGERKILFLVSSSQSFDQKWQNSSPVKSPV